jgi:hypothetical protein
MKKGHSAYVLQGNLLHDFLEEGLCPDALRRACGLRGEKPWNGFFPSQGRPNVPFS